MKKSTKISLVLFLLMLISTQTSFGVTNYWDGSFNTYWHNDNNWSLGHIPLSTEDVVITTSGQIPHVDFYDETCNSLTINAGATLRIADQTLTVSNAVSVYGTLELTNTIAKLYCTYMTWRNGSTGNMTGSSVISLSRNWEFSAGSNVNLTSGYVDFTGTIASYITTKDIDCAFNHIRNFKSGTYLSHSSASTVDFNINGNLYLYSGSELRSFSSLRIKLDGFLNNVAGSIHLDNGIFEFTGGTTTNYLNAGDYFYSLMISSIGTTTFIDPVVTTSFLWITQGVFNPSNNTVTVGAGWINQAGPAGFTEGTGRVVFNGTANQYVNYSEEFNILEVNKPGGALRVNDPAATVYCASYDWTAGAVDILQGTFTAASLADNGIAGTWYLNNGGEINLTNTSGYVDLLGNLYIYGGTMNIYGGIDDSYWPYGSAGSSITMSGGILDFKETGIYVRTSGTLTENITGGSIKTTGDLRLLRSDFTPTTSIFTMHGTENANIRLDAGSINQLDIAKTTAKTNSSGNPIPDYFSSKQEEGLPSPVIDTEYFTNNTSSQTNSQIIKQPRDGSSKSPKVIGDVVTPYADISLNHIVVYSGTFNPDNFAITLAGEMIVMGNLEMTSFWDEINMRDFFWYPGSTANVSMGFLNVDRDWFFQDGTSAQIGGINTVTFIGSTDQIMHCYDADAEYGIVISDKTGGQLYVNGSVKVTGNMTIGAGDYFHPILGDLIVEGTFDIVNTARMYLQAGTSITNNSEFILNGELTVKGNAFFHNNFQIASTGELIINTNGSLITDNNTTSTPIHGSVEMSDSGLFEVHSTITIYSTANINITGGTIRLSGDFILLYPNIWQPTGGTVEFFGIGHVSLSMAGSNHFHNLVINKDTGWQTELLYNDIVIKSDFTINSGIFNHYLVPTFTMEIGGNWTNNVGDAGFWEEESTVTFVDNGYSQVLTDETFYNLVCDKTAPWETWIDTDASVTTLNNLDIVGGNFRSPSATLDVNGNLTIATDALFVPPSFGKDLFVGGNWTNNNIANSNIKGFYPDGGSTVTFNGAGQQILTTNAPFEGFTNLIIDKSSDTLKSNDNTEVTGNFHILNGSWGGSVAGLEHTFYGNFTVEASGSWISSYDNHNTVLFAGTDNQNFTYNNDGLSAGYFSKVIVDKSAKSNKSLDAGFEKTNIPEDNNEVVGGTLNLLTSMKSMGSWSHVTINSGTLDLNGDTLIAIGSIEINPGGILIAPAGSNIRTGETDTLHVNGGELYANGTSSSKVLISNSNLGTFNFIVDNGGTISAEHTIFKNMAGNGLFINSNGSIDPLFPLNNCEFTTEFWSPPNSYLTINNNQSLTIDSTYFNYYSLGGSHNVSKGIDQGDLLFTNAYGYYAGPAFESDNYNRIDWTGFTPGLWTGAANNYWDDYRNWDNLVVPNATVDVVIPAGTPYSPLITLAAQYCNSLNVQAGANITINDSWLTVTNDVDILGGLTMDDALGTLNCNDINWRAGSDANVSLGIITVNGSWTFTDGTNAQLGAGNTTFFTGSTNQSIFCYDADASFGNLTIDKAASEAWLNNFSTDTLRVAGIFKVEAGNVYHVQNNHMLVNGSIVIQSSATMNTLSGGSITGISNISVAGTLEINQGDVFLGGLLFLTGGLIIDDGNFTITSASINITQIIGNGTMDLLNNSVFSAGSILMENAGTINMSSGLIQLAGNFTAYHPSTSFQPSGGSVEFTGSGVKTASFHPGNYFHDLIVNMPGQLHFSSDMAIKNDLNINNGGLYCGNYNIEIGGNWNNNVGPGSYFHGSGTVIFNGNGNNQNVTAETFYNVQQDYVSTGSNLLFLGPTTVLNDMTLNHYTWMNDLFDVQGFLDISNPTSIFTANSSAIGTIANLAQGGTMNLNGGIITVNDLAENGIYGSINVVSGELNYYQDASSFVDLNCDLSMTGGTFNINSSNDNSLWTFDGDASITMSGGILNFINCGILIQDNANTFTENISGGTIRTDGIFKANRSQFTPSGGTIEMYGGTDAEITAYPGANFHNLVINKSGGKSASNSYKDRDGNMVKAVMGNMTYFSSDVTINGDFTIDAGSLYFIGVTASCLGNVTINTGGTLSVLMNGTLALDNLKTLSVNSGGNLEVLGNSGNEAKITHNTGYYSFNIESGGTIGAEYGVFEYMHTNGVYLKPGSIVDPTFPFNNCYFRDGISGGRLMTVNTDDVFTVTDAIFPTNTWGSTHNIYKSANIGNVYFVGATGGFEGEVYEYDPYNHIHWTDHVLTLDLTVNLEGPFNGAGMNTELNSLLPLNQPYNVGPWYYTGTETVATIPNAQVVDWVLVEGRDAPDAVSATIATTFDRQAAFLLSDGSIVGMDGSSPIQFSYTLIDQLFVAILHRNHLGIISANPLSESGGIYTYDYSSGINQVLGGALGHKEIGSGIWGMFSGDASANGIINTADRAIWQNHAGTTGYKSADFDLNGQINNVDKNDLWTGNLGNENQLPE